MPAPMKRTVPAAAALSAALLALGVFGVVQARRARAAAEPARRLLAEIAPDLAAARAAELRLVRAHGDAFERPPQGEPAAFFAGTAPAAETAARPVAGAALELRTATLSWAAAPADVLSRGIAAAEAAGHKLAAAEIDPARPAGNVRAKLVFETILPARNTTP